MSLVNDMLRDLDKRKSLSASPSYVRALLDVEPKEEKKLPWMLLLMVVIGIAIGLGAGVYYFSIDADKEAVPENFPLISQGPIFEVQRNDISARVDAEIETETGREFRFLVSEKIEVEVLSKERSAINLLFANVDEIDISGERLSGVSMYPGSDGLTVSVSTDQAADFLIFKDESANQFVVVVEAVWKEGTSTQRVGRSAGANVEVNPIVITTVDSPMDALSSNTDVAEPQTQSRAAATIPARIIREQSLEQLDLVNSQKAVRNIQRGNIISAYEGLFEFIDLHPDAHESRQILATLLFSQEEFQQVGVVIDQGMELAPNNSAYKKIKARLLMHDGQNSKAAELLVESPPLLAEDAEYFELLASVYQQTGNHLSAIETYQDLLRNDGQQGKWWAGMAISLEAAGNVEDAVASFQTALRSVSLEQNLRQYSQNRVRNLSGQL